MKKKIKKFAYIQKWGTYTNETIVSVGMNHEDMIKYLRKVKAKFEIAEEFMKAKENIIYRLENSDGLTHIQHKTGATILMFSEWKNDWKYWDRLIHEITHLVHAMLGHDKNMMDEDEARAYQTEFLFKEIRRKLWKLSEK